MFSGRQWREKSRRGGWDGWSGEGHQPSRSSVTGGFEPGTGIMTSPRPLREGLLTGVLGASGVQEP